MKFCERYPRSLLPLMQELLITLDKTGGIPPDAQLIMIERPPPSGRRQAHRPRPTVTRTGVPVVVMGVDVDLYEDGTQHAADGSF